MLERAGKSLEYFLAVFFMGFVSIAVFNVGTRYLVGISFSWAEEVSRYLFIYVVFLGAAIGCRSGMHIGVDLFTAKLTGTPKRVVDTVAALGILVLSTVLVVYGLKAVGLTMHQSSPGLQIPMGYVYAAVPLGSLITLLFVGERLYKEWFSRRASERRS